MPMTAAAAADRLKTLPGWEAKGQAIVRAFAFEDFKQAMAFTNQVAEAAEAANHHPDIDIRYNQVTLLLTSHDAGGLTGRDFNLAGKINRIAS